MFYDASQHPIYDKLWFVDKAFGVETVIDFGCADGFLRDFVHEFMGLVQYIGYDVSSVLKANELEDKDDAVETDDFFTSKWKVVEKALENSRSAMIVFSSVLNEIYAYMPRNEANAFFQKVIKNKNIKYVAIRDMFVATEKDNPLATKQALHQLTNAIATHSDDMKRRYEEFQQLYKNTSFEGVMHFILKCQYTNNWDRELKQNYLAFMQNFNGPIQDILRKQGYIHQFSDYYTLQYLSDMTKEEFGISLNDIKMKTHIKTLWKRD